MLGKKGEGTFSDVLKCQSIESGAYAACKKMKQHYERFARSYTASRCLHLTGATCMLQHGASEQSARDSSHAASQGPPQHPAAHRSPLVSASTP